MHLPNLGNMESVGIDGKAVNSYKSELDVWIGDELYQKQPCVVDPTFSGADGLFGLRFYIDNDVELDLNTKQKSLKWIKKES